MSVGKPQSEFEGPVIRMGTAKHLEPHIRLNFALGIICVLFCGISATAQHVMGDPVDVSKEFYKLENTYFVGSTITSFDPVSASGTLEWKRYARRPSYSFNKVDKGLSPDRQNEEFPSEYDASPVAPFSIQFVSPRTIRLRVNTSNEPIRDEPSLMLVGDPPRDTSWKMTGDGKSITYKSEYGSVEIIKDPWEIQVRDASGQLLTSTQNKDDLKSFASPLPFSFVRRTTDFARSIAAVFSLSPDEKIFGCGESFTALNKRGQKLVLYPRDAMGVENARMYKPIPFFMSSNGYGMFLHTSTPVTVDFGNAYGASNQMYVGDDKLDLFIFLGQPKDIISEYTALTGRSPVPPLWSFGLWMSRITYKSEAEVRDVAAKLRQYKIPSDVIHIDTGWFETDWRCDYQFSKSRFHDPAKMLSDLKAQGFHVSLWQLPYFGPKNSLYDEIVKSGYAVRSADGGPPDNDATLDFSNPAAVKWYQGLLAGLLKMGVGAIKVVF
ncbi:MAG TPA: TIM-barrel domain-containing protein, partial [Blastocatellia bacterium]|nr:TIM-barrel domain-containing protein [Blastocatellia bacterium]